jgi:hypothetical protein
MQGRVQKLFAGFYSILALPHQIYVYYTYHPHHT